MCATKEERKIPARPYSKTNVHPLKAALKVRGIRALDQRDRAVRRMKRLEREVLQALGGSEVVSPQKRRLVGLYICSTMLREHVDAYLLETGQIVNKRGRRLFPIVRERRELADQEARLADALGLDGRVPPAPVFQPEKVTRR